jgi:hypothetical protein
VLIRTAIFKPATQLVGFLLQEAAKQIDAGYQPKLGEHRKARVGLQVQCLFGSFVICRDYYYHPGKHQGHYPADAALGLEGAYTPALARLICLEGADQSSYQQAQEHLQDAGGIEVSARQIQRVVQRVGSEAQTWQERSALPGSCDAPILYISADATGVPMRREELEGRVGQQPDGTAKTRSAYLGCVFTQHRRDDKGRPIRDYDSTTYVSSMGPLEDFGPLGIRKMQRSRWVRRLLRNGVENLIKETRAAGAGSGARAHRGRRVRTSTNGNGNNRGSSG